MTEARKQELQAELDSMSVYQETLVGWDENTPPNETLDQSTATSWREIGV